MRAATFNTCHGTAGSGTPVDLGALVAACRALDADLLALQEVDAGGRWGPSANQARVVAAELGMSYVWAPARSLDGVVSGNALLARGELHAIEPLVLRGSLRRAWPARDRRGALLAEVELGSFPVLSVAVAHLSIERHDSLWQQRQVLAALQARPGPRLLLGDLNRRTAWVAPDVEAAGFALARDDAPTSPRPTPRFRIDHLAVDGLEIDDVSVVDVGTSDHRALVASLSVPATAADSRPVRPIRH